MEISQYKFRKVIHLSDIHIRNYKRHKEYRQVFKRLYSYIKKNKTKDSVIVLTGDIVHLKTDISPELVSLLYEFLNTLNQILPVILIPGNHDANLNNKNRLDALQPVVNTIKNEHPFWYLRDSGVFTIGEVHWVHYGVFDNKDKYPTEIPNDGLPKVGLFHGAVDNIRTDTGYTLKSDVELSLFDDCDVVMLGDIHKPNNSPNGKETVKYPGSLLQQDHAESLGNHGLLVWDLEKFTSEMVVIKNDWGYVTIDVKKGKIVKKPDEFPKYPRIRVRYENTNYDTLQSIIREIKSKYQVKEISLIKINHDVRIGEDTNLGIGDVREVTNQNTLIETYASTQLLLTNEDINRLKEINKEINGELPKSNLIRNVKYVPKHFEFSNMFSYRGTSKLNFSNMLGMYGIFAPNASGKSSLFDAFTFTVWDRCKRTSKTSHVINNRSDKFHCKFVFELDGNEYVIERTGKRDKRDKTNIPVQVSFYQMENGEQVSLNGKDRYDTNQIIRQYLGTYDDFILTALSQQSGENFIDKTQKQRKEAFSQFLDLNVYDSLYRIGHEKYKDLSYDIKNRKTKLESEDVDKYKKFIVVAEKEIKQNEELKKELKQEITSKQSQIQSKTKTLRPVKLQTNDLSDVTEWKKLVQKAGKDQTKLRTQISTLENDIKKLNSRKNELIKLNEGKEKAFKLNKDRLSEFEQVIPEYEFDLVKIKSLISNHQKNIDHLSTHEFDPNCEFCVKNPFVQDAYNSQQELPQLIVDRDELVNKITELKTEVERLETLTEEYQTVSNKIIDFTQSIETAELKLSNTRYALENSISNTDKYTKLIQEFDINKVSIEFNIKVQDELLVLDEELVELNSNLDTLNDKIIDYKGKLSAIEKIVENLEQEQETLDKLELSYKYLGLYLKCVSRDGIPYIITSDLIPKIQHLVNDILFGIVDFQIEIETDGKNVNIYIKYSDDYWPLELGSGMEKFVSGVAIRSALCSITTLPKPNFIAIDEGMAVLDKENLSEVHLLFNYLKTQFDFVIVISHLEKIQDIVDHTIEIHKTKEGSKINF